MEDAVSFTGGSIATVWEDSLRFFLSRRDLVPVDTDTAGPTIELDSVILKVREPLSSPRISDLFPLPNLIDDYWSLFVRPGSRRPQDALTIGDRIYAWPRCNGKPLDQMKKVVSELRSNPITRRAVVQLWNPPIDLVGGTKTTPLGHCFLHFSVRGGQLNMTVSSRSIDAWNGALPNLLAFAGLQEEVAKKIEVPVGWLAHHVISYHLYIRDLPTIQSAVSGKL